ncbi:MAG: response regulator [Alphaproteobacteria bacterium]
MPLKILYVDDEPDIREIAIFALELDGTIEASGCASGAEALDRVRAARPDLVLLDVMMPGLDGPATLARLRGMREGRDLPVVFITAKAGARDTDRFLALGALGVIAKPFDPMALAGQVHRFWAQVTQEKT